MAIGGVVVVPRPHLRGLAPVVAVVDRTMTTAIETMVLIVVEQVDLIREEDITVETMRMVVIAMLEHREVTIGVEVAMLEKAE
jgi:hypothetical protein